MHTEGVGGRGRRQLVVSRDARCATDCHDEARKLRSADDPNTIFAPCEPARRGSGGDFHNMSRDVTPTAIAVRMVALCLMVFCIRKSNAELVFSASRGRAQEIYTIDERAGEPSVRNLTNHFANDYMPDWSPDGRQIAFTRQLAESTQRTAVSRFPLTTPGVDSGARCVPPSLHRRGNGADVRICPRTFR